MAGRIVTIAVVRPNAFKPEDRSDDTYDPDESYNPFVNAAVVINDAGKTRRIRGSALRLIIPDGTKVFCPKIGWWNPPAEFFHGPRGDTRLVAPVNVRVGKLVRIDDDYGDEFIDYWIEVLDGDFAGQRGTDDGLSSSCEPADRPGVKLVFHFPT